MIDEKEVEQFYPKDQGEWRQWLQDNHRTKQSVWLIMYKKKSGNPSINWSQAVDEVLCFGWIDSKSKPLDDEKYMQFFTRRKPKGTWSKVNKEKIKVLIETGKMTEAGIEVIDAAKKNGSWTILDEVEDYIVPKDLVKAFKMHRGSQKYFEGLSKSVQKGMLHRIAMAKRPETRQKRIDEIIEQLGPNKKP